MTTHPMSYTIPVILLIVVVTLGMLVNLVMLGVTVRRHHRLKLRGEFPRDEIVSITVNRAMRLEFIFFLCQVIRLVHTYYEVHQDPTGNIYRTDMGAVLERAIVTLLLVVASTWDYYDRSRLALYLDLLDVRKLGTWWRDEVNEVKS